MAVLFNEGKDNLMNWLWIANPVDVLAWGLFLLPTTLGVATTLGAMTLASFTGYANVNLNRATFVNGGITAGELVYTNTQAPTFTCTGGAAQTCYGWVLINVTQAEAIAGDLFAVPRVMAPSTTEVLNPLSFYLRGY